MSSNPDLDVLRRVSATEDFFRSVLFGDNLHDGSLAKDFGEFLVRIVPEDLGAHLILVKAYRHLGELHRAVDGLEVCRGLVAGGMVGAVEKEALLPILQEEERHLSLVGKVR